MAPLAPRLRDVHLAQDRPRLHHILPTLLLGVVHLQAQRGLQRPVQRVGGAAQDALPAALHVAHAELQQRGRAAAQAAVCEDERGAVHPRGDADAQRLPPAGLHQLHQKVPSGETSVRMMRLAGRRGRSRCRLLGAAALRVPLRICQPGIEQLQLVLGRRAGHVADAELQVHACRHLTGHLDLRDSEQVARLHEMPHSAATGNLTCVAAASALHGAGREGAAQRWGCRRRQRERCDSDVLQTQGGGSRQGQDAGPKDQRRGHPHTAGHRQQRQRGRR
mmetsp:Transcript_20912/g.52614  ORF Transcript_20912/g.52614 Transcript_20912/m.52614 type:complete len:277 (+) Transcript_20912:666-1496(+)